MKYDNVDETSLRIAKWKDEYEIRSYTKRDILFSTRAIGYIKNTEKTYGNKIDRIYFDCGLLVTGRFMDFIDLYYNENYISKKYQYEIIPVMQLYEQKDCTLLIKIKK